MAPVFITTGLGYFWARAGKHFDTNLVTSIVTYFATPCLTFAALATVELGGDTLVLMGTAALAANVIFALIGWPVLKVFNLSPRTYLQSLTWPNVGNVGLPLCMLAYGQEGLALSVAFFAAYVVIQLTIGVAFVSGSFSIKSLAKMPIIPATLIATGFLALQAHMSGWETHIMGGIDADDARKILALPDGVALHTGIAIGRTGAAESLPEDLRDREVASDRNPLPQIAFEGRFPDK